MNEIVVKSEHVALIEAVKDILLTACHEPAFHSSEKALQHKRCLDEIGFSALGETNFGSMNTSTVISAELASDLLQMLCEK
jgi:neurofibromin 1